jgi:curved DNA-binding protein CbpA
MITANIKNHYAALGVRPDANRREILKARNRLLHRWHPDINREYPEEAKEKTIDILLAAEILLDEKSRAEYDRTYQDYFQSSAKGCEDIHDIGESEVRDATQKRSGEFIVCPYCGRKNMRSKRKYCLFCGAGIGEDPRPFSWKDVDVHSPAYKEQYRNSIFEHLIFNGDIILLLAAAVCILAYVIISGGRPGLVFKIALLIFCVIYIALQFRD